MLCLRRTARYWPFQSERATRVSVFSVAGIALFLLAFAASESDIFIAPELGEQVLRLDSDGVLQQTYNLIAPPGLNFGRPEDITSTPDGDLIVLDALRDVFEQLDVTSGMQAIIDPLVFESFSFGVAVESVTQASTLITSGGFYSSGNGFRSATVVPVPEPSTATLLLLGLASIGGWASRRPCSKR